MTSSVALSELIDNTVAGLGFELVEFESSPRGRLLRVFIDKVSEDNTQSAITLEDCTMVSNQLSRVFAVENIDYDRLEVSSPGMDRVLTKPAHYTRFIGHEVRLKLRVPQGNQRNFTGVIGRCDADVLHLRVDTNEMAIPLGNVEKARLAPKF